MAGAASTSGSGRDSMVNRLETVGGDGEDIAAREPAEAQSLKGVAFRREVARVERRAKTDQDIRYRHVDAGDAAKRAVKHEGIGHVLGDETVVELLWANRSSELCGDVGENLVEVVPLRPVRSAKIVLDRNLGGAGSGAPMPG